MTQASEHLGESLGTDYFFLREQLTDEQWRRPAPRAASSSTTRCCR